MVYCEPYSNTFSLTVRGMECENTVSLAAFFITNAVMFYCGFVICHLINKRKMKAMKAKRSAETNRAGTENPEMARTVGQVMNAFSGMMANPRARNPSGRGGPPPDLGGLVQALAKGMADKK